MVKKALSSIFEKKSSPEAQVENYLLNSWQVNRGASFFEKAYRVLEQSNFFVSSNQFSNIVIDQL